MNTIEKIALNKAFATVAKAIDQSPLEGNAFKFDHRFSIRLIGELKIGKSYLQVCDPSIPWEKIALAALSHLNTSTRSHILSMALQGESFDIPLKEIKDAVKGESVAIKGKAEKQFKGKVTGKLAIA